MTLYVNWQLQKFAETLMSISFILQLVDFCRGDPCGSSLATCISLQSNYTCVCQYGFYYSNKDCHKGELQKGINAFCYLLG